MLAKKLGRGVREDLSVNVKLVLVSPSYNVRRDQKDDYAKYDVFSSKDTKGIANVSRKVRRP